LAKLLYHDRGQQAKDSADKRPDRTSEEDSEKGTLIRVGCEDDRAEEAGGERNAPHNGGTDKSKESCTVKTKASEKQQNRRAPKGAREDEREPAATACGHEQCQRHYKDAEHHEYR